MARCQCGGAGCNCVIVAGPNTNITGSGSTPNPYIVEAVTNCAEVRQCLSAGPGVNYDPSTGQISADVSGQPGNNLVLGPDGLFVPAGAATVATGCGLQGDGSASAPVTAKTGAWPFACSVDTYASNVYCDSAGNLRTDPRPTAKYVEANTATDFPDLLVPTSATLVTVHTDTLDITNNDPCRDAFVILEGELDVDLVLPPGGGAAIGYSSDEMVYQQNSGTSTIRETHIQVTKVSHLTVPAGGTVTAQFRANLGRGSAGATYNRVQWFRRAFVFNL